MLKRKRKLFTLGLTVFMAVTVLCSNVVHASGVGTADLMTENYIEENIISSEVNEGSNEEADEVIAAVDSVIEEVQDEWRALRLLMVMMQQKHIFMQMPVLWTVSYND